MKKTEFNKIYLIYFVVILAFVCLRIASNLGAFSFIENATILSLVTSLIIQIGILFLLPLFLVKTVFKKSIKNIFSSFNFKIPSIKVVLLSFGIGIFACILNFFIAFIFSAILSLWGYEGLRGLATSSYSYNTLLKFLIGALCVGVLPAFCEEFLHRGFVLQESKNHVGYKRAIIISSVLFGLMHLNVNQVFYAIILGLIMGFVAVAANNIWPAIIMHFTNNFINVYLDFAAAKSLPFGDLGSVFINIFSKNFAIGLILCSVVVCFSVLGIILFISLLYKETRYKELERKFVALQSDMLSINKENAPLSEEEIKMGFDIYYKQSFKDVNSVVDLMIPKTDADTTKLKLNNKVFLIGSLLLGVIITVFTFIWGVF